MLAVYQTIIKHDQIMPRIGQDALEIGSIANDLVCELKTLAVDSQSRNLESCLERIKEITTLTATLDTMVKNAESNLRGYASSLAHVGNTQEVKQEPQQSTEEIKRPEAGPEQVTSVLDAIKTLKQIHDSMKNEK